MEHVDIKDVATLDREEADVDAALRDVQDSLFGTHEAKLVGVLYGNYNVLPKKKAAVAELEVALVDVVRRTEASEAATKKNAAAIGEARLKVYLELKSRSFEAEAAARRTKAAFEVSARKTSSVKLRELRERYYASGQPVPSDVPGADALAEYVSSRRTKEAAELAAANLASRLREYSKDDAFVEYEKLKFINQDNEKERARVSAELEDTKADVQRIAASLSGTKLVKEEGAQLLEEYQRLIKRKADAAVAKRRAVSKKNQAVELKKAELMETADYRNLVELSRSYLDKVQFVDAQVSVLQRLEGYAVGQVDTAAKNQVAPPEQTTMDVDEAAGASLEEGSGLSPASSPAAIPHETVAGSGGASSPPASPETARLVEELVAEVERLRRELDESRVGGSTSKPSLKGSIFEESPVDADEDRIEAPFEGPTTDRSGSRGLRKKEYRGPSHALEESYLERAFPQVVLPLDYPESMEETAMTRMAGGVGESSDVDMDDTGGGTGSSRRRYVELEPSFDYDLLVRRACDDLVRIGQLPTASDYVKIMRWAADRFGSLPTLLELRDDLTIVGDTHGQFEDTLEIMKQLGMPPGKTYLFLGDYVDRGPMSCENVLFVFCLAMMHPRNVFLLRGNHESRSASGNGLTSFLKECERKYGDMGRNAWSACMDACDDLPLYAIVKGVLFCVHGGIASSVVGLDQLRLVDRKTEIPRSGLVSDMMWSDPSDTISGRFEKNTTRGIAGRLFSAAATADFLRLVGCAMLVRGHQPRRNGFEVSQNGRTVTVFSAPNYEHTDNWAGVMEVTNDSCVLKTFGSSRVPT
jgi:serine/threonine-protein phosphatase PP1 catalytic subunit